MFQASSWFKRLYPASALPAGRVKNLLQRVEKKFSELNANPAALDSMLRERFSVNGISPTLDSNGIDWANIHGPSKFVFPSGFHLSYELVIELETFRSKEHEKSGFLSEWLSRLQGKAVVTSECMKSVCSMMKTYKGLCRNKARDGAKLSAFLKEEFKSGEKHVPTASVSMLPLSKTHRKNKVNVNHTTSSCSFKRQGKRKKWKSWRRTSWRRKFNIWTMF